MKKLLIFVLFIIFIACRKDDLLEQKPPWETAAIDYKCTTKQMEAVQKDTEWCSAHTSYFSTYCYGTMIMMHCNKRSEIKK